MTSAERDTIERLTRQLEESNREIQRLQMMLSESQDSMRMVVKAAGPHLPAIPERPDPYAAAPVTTERIERLIVGPQDPSTNGLYQQFKDRLIADLQTDKRLVQALQVLAVQPELEVWVRQEKVEADASTGRGAIGLLIAEGFFDSGATASAAYTEVKKRGVKIGTRNAYILCDKFVSAGFLRKEADGYQIVPGVKKRIVRQ